MKDRKWNTLRWGCGLLLLLPLLGGLALALLAVRQVEDLPGALGDFSGVEGLTRVIVPGETELDFPEPGAYAVYYEYRGVIDSVAYELSPEPPDLDCSLVAAKDGQSVSLSPDYAPGNTYATRKHERVGVLWQSIPLKEAGVYRFACRYPDGRQGPRVGLAVGPNLMWELFNAFSRPVVAGLAGAGGALLFACGLALALLLGLTVRLARPAAGGSDASPSA